MFYVVKQLINTQGQDASSISSFEDGENMSAEEKALVYYHGILQTYHNAPDVLYAVVQILEENGNSKIKEIVDHRPKPEPEPTPEETVDVTNE